MKNVLRFAVPALVIGLVIGLAAGLMICGQRDRACPHEQTLAQVEAAFMSSNESGQAPAEVMGRLMDIAENEALAYEEYQDLMTVWQFCIDIERILQERG